MDSDSSRHRLHTRLEEVLGREPADTLMTHLPTPPGLDLVTKQDLAHGLDASTALLRAEMEVMKAELTALFRAELNDQTRTMVFAMVATVLTVVLILVGAFGLLVAAGGVGG